MTTDQFNLRSFSLLPLAAALAGGALTLGLFIGQDREADASDAGSSPMAGMDHSGGGGMAGMDHSGMAGMDHSGMAGGDQGAVEPATTPMDMSAPGMAAQMPGGVHAECQETACTVVFAKGATGAATVLGGKLLLEELTAKEARLLLDGKRLVLRAGKKVQLGAITFTITRIDAQEVSLAARTAAPS
jgi:hypothetical protein